MLTVKFWGVRGSIPVPGEDTVKIGGNTSCIEIMNDKNELLIIDAGTGIKNLGNHIVSAYLATGMKKCSLILTHTHWDHIQGLPFFTPLYLKDFEIYVYGPARDKDTIENILAGQMNYPYYPVKISDLKAKIFFNDIEEKPFTIGSYQIIPKVLNHPVKTYGYKIFCEGKIITTVYDHEIYRNVVLEDNPMIMNDLKIGGEEVLEASKEVSRRNQEIVDFIRDSNILIYDAFCTEKEYYDGKQGWGHGPIEFLIENTKHAPVRNLVLFHHAPEKKDKDVLKMKKYLENFVKSLDYKVNLIIAKEGLKIKL
ncbi:MAG TPA: MBL fold metallo-hydrolase [Spirochaetia bacterium]|nr:MAG: hypothetical protein A2Y41_10465 [Spirochaetes bacterium GWB1_36_13]HCL55880.1 MBL fold metallo-hydrolase [Spirochaetia bacterium]